MIIRAAKDEDLPAIFAIFSQVVQGGDTFPYPQETSIEEFKDIWFGKGMKAFVLVDESIVIASYVIKPLWPGRGSHIAHGSYMVDPKVRGKGAGQALGQHSIEEAKRLGFSSMQFNLVVSTNEAAVRLWQKLGFKIVGTVPQAFRHEEHGLVDAFVMHRQID
jgi:L-amino acid N-acyltransferase YncA